MRPILLTFCLLAALPAVAAGLEGKLHRGAGKPLLLDSDFESGAPVLVKGGATASWVAPARGCSKVKQGSAAYSPWEGRRVQELAKKVEADIEEELK